MATSYQLPTQKQTETPTQTQTQRQTTYLATYLNGSNNTGATLPDPLYSGQCQN